MAASGSRLEFPFIRSMKRPGLTPPLASATLFLLLASSWPLLAQEMMSPAQSARAAQRGEELLKRYDKNGDGRIDDDERAEAKEVALKEQVDRQMARAAALPGGLEQFRTQALQMFDRNRDGQLDEAERSSAQKFATAREEEGKAAETMNRLFDKNGNGTVDADERTEIENYLSALRALATGQMRLELLRRFDRNADGKIDDEEFPELEKFVRPRIESSPPQFRRYDADSDGKLDDAEWTAARAAIAAWLNSADGAGKSPEALRGQASTEMQRAPSQAGGPAKTQVDIEAARLKAVAEEVTRRRAERAATQKTGSPRQ
jgi:Ca2+-binding EF-hand superfamily protein